MQSPIRRKASVFPYRGKFRIQYLDSFGRTRTASAETRQAAYLKLAEIEGQIRSGYLHLMNKELPTFAQWLDYWLEARKPELNPTTWHGYESTVRNWLKPSLGQLRIDSVLPRQIQDLYSYLQQTEDLSAGTIRRMHSLLSSALAMAQKQGLIAKSPIESVKQPKLVKKVIEVFTIEEVETILRHASQKPPVAFLRWLLALRYGLRQGEVLGLKFSDFDLTQMTLKVQRTVNSVPGKGIIELPTKSTNATRVIPIDQQVMQLLSQLGGSVYLFTTDSGALIDATVDARRWKALLLGAGVRQLPLHSARHTCATHLMQKGVNPRVVQMILGHSSPAYTLATYVHPSVEELRLAVELASHLSPKPMVS